MHICAIFHVYNLSIHILHVLNILTYIFCCVFVPVLFYAYICTQSMHTFYFVTCSCLFVCLYVLILCLYFIANSTMCGYFVSISITFHAYVVCTCYMYIYSATYILCWCSHMFACRLHLYMFYCGCGCQISGPGYLFAMSPERALVGGH